MNVRDKEGCCFERACAFLYRSDTLSGRAVRVSVWYEDDDDPIAGCRVLADSSIVGMAGV